MKVIYSHNNLALAGYVQGVLADSGIECRLRNQYLAGVAGELPPVECWPQVVVDDDRLEAQAKALVEELMSAADQPAAEWRCGGCGEMIEGQFTACWNCGADRPQERL